MSGRGRGINNAPAWMSSRQPPPDGLPPPMNDRDTYGRSPRGGPPPYPPSRDYHGYPPPPRGDYPPPRDYRGPPPHRGGRRRGGNRSGIVFRSYQEEREWTEERRRKRMERKSLWDVTPTAEQAALDAQQAVMTNFAATDFSGGVADSGLPQQTRHARRLYLGNLPPNVNETELHDFFYSALQQASLEPLTEDPILSVYINHERRFCFLEFKSVEMTTAALQLDGINVNNKGKLHIKRPNDYNPLTAPPVHPSKIPRLDVSKLGIVSRAVQDGPNKVFVGGLHYHLTEDQVLELLQAFGKVKAMHLVANEADPSTSKGYCFVEYVDPNVTQVAIVGLNGMDLGGGKVLTARIAASTDSAAGSGNFVGGYDVEALLDAAMGLRPMPFGPGDPSVMIGTSSSTPATVTQSPPVAAAAPAPVALAAPAPSAEDIANRALAVVGQQQQQQQAPPTRILVLNNMVMDEDLATDQDHAALMEEVGQECAKFGNLLSMNIPRRVEGNVAPSAIKKVFLEYASPADAQAANQELDGRQFGPNVVQTTYFSEQDYLEKKLY